MKKRILIIIFLFFIACKKNYTGEIEPNNSFDEATPIELDREIRGYLDSGTDSDYYQFICSGEKLVALELSAVKGVNHAVEVYFDNGGRKELVKMIDDVRKSASERMPNLFIGSGRYYIRVMFGDRDDAEGNTDSFYSLRLTTSEYVSGEKEGNDNFRSATLLEQGEKSGGYFFPAFNKLNHDAESELREEDYYFIEVDCSAESPVLLDVSLSAVENVDSVLNLYDPFQVLIATSNHNGTGSGENLTDIGLTKPGKYYISVFSGNYEANYDMKYEIQAFIKPYDASVEMEINNDINSANMIMDSVINGKIFPAGDVDFFRFTPENQKSISRIEVLPPVGMDIRFDILNDSGDVLFSVDNGKDGEKEIFPNFYSESVYMLKVYSQGAYADAESGYAVSVNENRIEDIEEREPNDSTSAANIVKTKIIKGYISHNNDKDYYAVEPGTRVKVKFSVSGIEGSEFEFSVTDSLGYVIKTETIKSTEVSYIEEMIDIKGYLVIESKGQASNFPYYIEIGD